MATKEIKQNAKCVPNSPTAKCWKIRLLSDVPMGDFINFHVKVGSEFYKGALNKKGESGLFSADKVTHDDVYFDLKILPDYSSGKEAIKTMSKDGTIFTSTLGVDKLKKLIWADKCPIKDFDNGCATRLSYVFNRFQDCKYTYPRLLNDPELRKNWTELATANPVPNVRSHAIPGGASGANKGETYDPKTGVIDAAGKPVARHSYFRYLTAVTDMYNYILTADTDAPRVTYGNFHEGPKKYQLVTGHSAPADAPWVGCALIGDKKKATPDTGHADIVGGAQGLEGYKGLVEIHYWKFTKVIPDTPPVKSDPDGSTVLCFKHVLASA